VKSSNRNISKLQYAHNRVKIQTAKRGSSLMNYRKHGIKKQKLSKYRDKMLIVKAKERDKSQKRYLALSQKVISEGQNEKDEEIPSMPAESYQNRPFTSAYGQRTLASANPRDNSNGRLMSRKQKFRGQINSQKKSRKINMKNAEIQNFQGKNPVERLKNLEYSTNKPVYHENDVKGLRIVDYFRRKNRLDRYIKKSKERFRRANKH